MSALPWVCIRMPGSGGTVGDILTTRFFKFGYQWKQTSGCTLAGGPGLSLSLAITSGG